MKNILLFMTNFYGYHKNVITELENQGYNVTWFLDKVELSTKDRVINKFVRSHASKLFDAYFEKSIESVKNCAFDEILIIFGANFFKEKHITFLRNCFPGTKIVYYAWDSVDNFPGIEDLLLKTDISYTFDYNDSKKYGVGFLPLFYVNNEIDENDIVFDVSTVMSFFVEKSDGVKRAIDSLPDDSVKYLYLRVRDKLYYRKLQIFHAAEISGLEPYFHFEALSSNEVNDVFVKSKAVIDCPLPKQNGLTMRTFETLALGKKLVTTNKNIAFYDFYTPQNIFIVDGVNKLPEDFFSTDFDQNFKLSDKYSICSFVKTLTE